MYALQTEISACISIFYYYFHLIFFLVDLVSTGTITGMRRLRVAVVVWAALALARGQWDFKDLLALKNDVDTLRCNSTLHDYKKYYSRLRQGIRESGGFDYYVPGGAC